jgi:hypothetical protein
MNYGLESSSGIHYDVHHQSYVQERQGITYKLDKDTQQWVPLESYVDQKTSIRYNFSKIHHQWIPEQSTYSIRDEQGQEQSYVWLKDDFKWSLLSLVDAYTDHRTGLKYCWNVSNQSWDQIGSEPIEENIQIKNPVIHTNTNTTTERKSNLDSANASTKKTNEGEMFD